MEAFDLKTCNGGLNADFFLLIFVGFTYLIYTFSSKGTSLMLSMLLFLYIMALIVLPNFSLGTFDFWTISNCTKSLVG